VAKLIEYKSKSYIRVNPIMGHMTTLMVLSIEELKNFVVALIECNLERGHGGTDHQ
jgi:hypothetical protein